MLVVARVIFMRRNPGAAKDGSVKVSIVARVIFERRKQKKAYHRRRRPVFVQFALRWGRNWAAQWRLARAEGRRFRGCRAKRLYVYGHGEPKVQKKLLLLHINGVKLDQCAQ